jgi:hypothetical protein
VKYDRLLNLNCVVIDCLQGEALHFIIKEGSIRSAKVALERNRIILKAGHDKSPTRKETKKFRRTSCRGFRFVSFWRPT